MIDIEQVKNILEKYGQEHLLQFWDDLSESEKTLLLTDVGEFDVAEVVSYYNKSVKFFGDGKKNLDNLMKPIPPEVHGGVNESTKQQIQEYEAEGLKHISNGSVGVLLLAGGQGTRLGVNYPKGMFDVGLPSQKTLYQIQAERIKRLEELAFEQNRIKNSVTWYIMTSESTMTPTIDFFRQNDYFGLNKKNIVFFEQGVLPCFDFNGKIILDNKHKISKAPDGNGGLYRALRDRGILDDIEKRKIKYLHAYCVDNILVKVADPVFIGYCVLKNAQCGAKVVEKTNPTEAVGVVCEVNGKYQVVEYSEISEETAKKRNSNGKLTFNAGNICNHFFTTKFLQQVATTHEKNLILHVAKKKIPFVDSQGNLQKPSVPNGIKMEKFVFDVFQFADNFVTWFVDRKDEFSPLKNSDAAEKENPTTARNDIYDLHKRFIVRAGGVLCDDKEEGLVCEISPLVSYAGEGLKFLKDKKIKSPMIVDNLPFERCVITNGIH